MSKLFGRFISDYFKEQDTINKTENILEALIKFFTAPENREAKTFSESELARHFGTSTTVIRECLLKISSMGFIKKLPRSGWEIVKISKEDIIDLLEMRYMVEKYAIEKVIRQAKAHPFWKELTEVLEQCQSPNRKMCWRMMKPSIP